MSRGLSKAAERCQLCASNGFDTAKFHPAPGPMAICPRCDRRRCGECKRPVLDGHATRCACGRVLGL